jgi:hypothetical protein
MSKKKIKRSEKENELLGIIQLKHGESLPVEAFVPTKNELKTFEKNETHKNERYWIKEGVSCFHIDNPKLKMRVMKINQVPKQINDGNGKLVVKMFTVNVDVQWFDNENKIQTTKFTTKELRPFKDDISS